MNEILCASTCLISHIVLGGIEKISTNLLHILIGRESCAVGELRATIFPFMETKDLTSTSSQNEIKWRKYFLIHIWKRQSSWMGKGTNRRNWIKGNRKWSEVYHHYIILYHSKSTIYFWEMRKRIADNK